MLYFLLLRRIGFLLFVASAFPLFAGTMEIKIHSNLPIVETENSERVAIFNSRSDYGSNAKVWVAIEKKPIPRKEFILVEPPRAEWAHGNVWRVEDVLDNKGEIDEFSKLVVLDKASDWGKEDKFSATVTYYQVREHPLPPNPDGSPADNGPYFAGSDTKSLIVVAPEVSLESITFNHVPGNSDFDGIDLRKNYSDPDIIGPEWTPSGKQPVAYRAGVRPTVKVDFRIRPSRLNRVRAKADESGGMGLTWGISESWSCSSSGIFSGVTAVSSTIDKGDVTWKWYVTGFNGVAVSGWNEIQTTTVPVYKILDRPKSPWKEGAGTQKPWTDALDFAIEKCGTKGLTTERAAIKRVTEYLDSSSTWWYNEEDNNPSTCTGLVYVDSAVKRTFAYSKFQNGGPINCYDSAWGIVAVASSLGLEVIAQYQIPWGNWDAHCYAVFSGSVYDSCRASTTPLVVEGNLEFFVNKLSLWGRKSGTPKLYNMEHIKDFIKNDEK